MLVMILHCFKIWGLEINFQFYFNVRTDVYQFSLDRPVGEFDVVHGKDARHKDEGEQYHAYAGYRVSIFSVRLTGNY